MSLLTTTRRPLYCSVLYGTIYTSATCRLKQAQRTLKNYSTRRYILRLRLYFIHEALRCRGRLFDRESVLMSSSEDDMSDVTKS